MPHAVNNGFYGNQGEVQLTGYAGSAGLSTMGGVAVTDNISVMGMYAGNPGAGGYHDKETEFSLGINNGRKGHKLMYGICGGYGFGSNFKQDSGALYKTFSGDFTRPFVVLSIGSISQKSSGMRAEASFSLRFNYLTYNGNQTTSKGVVSNFNAEHFYYEPYMRGNVGGRHMRFDYGMGFAFKNLREAGKGARIFPVEFNVGLTLLFGRKYNDE